MSERTRPLNDSKLAHGGVKCVANGDVDIRIGVTLMRPLRRPRHGEIAAVARIDSVICTSNRLPLRCWLCSFSTDTRQPVRRPKRRSSLSTFLRSSASMAGEGCRLWKAISSGESMLLIRSMRD